MKKINSTTFAYICIFLMVSLMVAICYITPTDKEIQQHHIQHCVNQLDSIFTKEPGFYDVIENIDEYQNLLQARQNFRNSTTTEDREAAYNEFCKYYDQMVEIYANFYVENVAN